MACEALRDVTRDTDLAVKCVRLWDSLTQPCGLFHLLLSGPWVPQILVLGYAQWGWRCSLLSAATSLASSRRSFKRTDLAHFGDFPCPSQSLSLWIRQTGPDEWLNGQPDQTLPEFACRPCVDACLPSVSHQQAYDWCANTVEQFKIRGLCIVGPCSFSCRPFLQAH